MTTTHISIGDIVRRHPDSLGNPDARFRVMSIHGERAFVQPVDDDGKAIDRMRSMPVVVLVREGEG